MNDISTKEYLNLKSLDKRLRYVHGKFNLPGTVEDFISNYHTEFLSGYRQHQTLDQYAIDYLRTKIGRTGFKMDSEVVMEYVASRDEGSSDQYSHSLIDLIDEINQLKGKMRVIIGLHLIFGLKQEEIAFLFGLTPGAIYYMTKEYLDGHKKPKYWPEDKPFTDEPADPFKSNGQLKVGYLRNIEKAAKILNVKPLWLREKIEELK